MDLIIPKYLPIWKYIVIDVFFLVSHLVLSYWREITNSVLSCSIVFLFWGMVADYLFYSPLFVIDGICYQWKYIGFFCEFQFVLSSVQRSRIVLWLCFLPDALTCYVCLFCNCCIHYDLHKILLSTPWLHSNSSFEHLVFQDGWWHWKNLACRGICAAT